MQLIRSKLRSLLIDIVQKQAADRDISLPSDFQVTIEYPPKLEFGHYATPVAMQLAKIFQQNPRQIGEAIKEILEQSDFISSISIEGPGFLNITLQEQAFAFLLAKGFNLEHYQEEVFKQGQKRKILFEFVSANPTGPLNIVSARAAAVGDTICRVLEVNRNEVRREYYVNDYGNQVRLLGLSFAYRFLQSQGLEVVLPEGCYQGDYIKTYQAEITSEVEMPEEFTSLTSIPEEAALQKLADFFAPKAIAKILATQQNDLEDFRVSFNAFFSEASLHQEGKVEEALEALKEKKYIFEREGAQYFRSTDFGDDKDRVVKRSDGRPTYLLADIAYHKSKIDRGYDLLYDIWGPDHHGYIARLKGAVSALGFEDNDERCFSVLIVQQVNLLEDGKPVVMSKRLGQFHTMRDLIEKVPVDVSRYFFVTRAQSTHLDFDLQLALDQSSKNPVYYIQYAHARIYSIFEKCGVDLNAELDLNIEKLSEWLDIEGRKPLLVSIMRYNEILEDIGQNLEVHRLATYLYELASTFTTFYHVKENRMKDVLADNRGEGEFLLALSKLTAAVLANGLTLLGIQAPTEM